MRGSSQLAGPDQTSERARKMSGRLGHVAPKDALCASTLSEFFFVDLITLYERLGPSQRSVGHPTDTGTGTNCEAAAGLSPVPLRQ